MQKQIHHALHRLYSRFHLYHEHVRFRDHHVHRPPRLRAHHAFDHLVVHVLHDHHQYVRHAYLVCFYQFLLPFHCEHAFDQTLVRNLVQRRHMRR